MTTVESIRTAAQAWAAEHPDVKVLLDEDGMQPDYPDAVQISVNDPDDELIWTGWLHDINHTVFMTDASDDMDEDERERIEAAADELVSYIKDNA
jgi:hypothetical protein